MCAARGQLTRRRVVNEEEEEEEEEDLTENTRRGLLERVQWKSVYIYNNAKFCDADFTCALVLCGRCVEILYNDECCFIVVVVVFAAIGFIVASMLKTRFLKVIYYSKLRFLL